MDSNRAKFNTAVLLILSCFFPLTFGKESVHYAAVIFRHGQRTIIDTYPTDPWRNESLWPVRFGELTNTGKMQHYALGKWFRTRYADLISEQFDPDEVYIKSTDVDRTLMSAQANLAGLYPPVGKGVWNKQLPWQPIPIHTESEAEDATLAMSKPCYVYEQEYARFTSSQEFKEKLKMYQKLMDYLTAYTGRKVKDFDDICYINSILYIETLFNLTLPNWTEAVYPDAMRKPACYSFATHTSTPLLARLRSGPLLKQIVNNMDKVIGSKKDVPVIKFSMYSGHDITVSDILNALKLFDYKCPVFTATVLFELIYDDSTNRYFVSISYRNSTEIVEPHLLSIPYCGKQCPIERFKKLYKNILDVNWEVECDTKFSEFTKYFYSCYFLGTVILCLLLASEKGYFTRAHFTGYSFRSKPSELSLPTKSPPEVEKLAQ